MAVNREQVLQSAEKLLAKGKLDQALKEYLRVLEDNAKDISTLNKVGDLYIQDEPPGRFDPFFTRIADFYSRDGFFLKAIAIFKKINKIDRRSSRSTTSSPTCTTSRDSSRTHAAGPRCWPTTTRRTTGWPTRSPSTRRWRRSTARRAYYQVRLRGPLPLRESEGRGRDAVRPDRLDAPEAGERTTSRAGFPEGPRACPPTTSIRRRTWSGPSSPRTTRTPPWPSSRPRPTAGESRALRRGAGWRDGAAGRGGADGRAGPTSLTRTPRRRASSCAGCGCRNRRRIAPPP